MNILLFCGNLSYAGAQRQLLELAKGLNQKHSVLVCSISSDTPLLGDFKKNNVNVEVFNLRTRNVFSIIKKLKALIEDYNIEVIYSFLKTANTYSRIIKFFKPIIKVISSERSSDVVADFKTKLAEKILSKKTDLYIANSFAGKNALFKNFGIENVKVVHNGIDETRFLSLEQPKFDVETSDKIVISIVGRIKPDKNYEMFLSVANKVCELHKNVVFLAVGDQPSFGDTYKESIFKIKDTLTQKDRINFIGARSDVPEILSVSDISVLTSHREGCSNTVLESMFAKCPLVVTDVGDNKEMLSELNKDFIVAPSSIDEMVEKLSILIQDSDLREKLGEANRKKALENFTQQKMVENTEKIVLELLEKK